MGDNMKKRLLMIIVIGILIFVCSCSNEKNAIELKSGKYVEVENGLSWVVLKENNEFEFNRYVGTSYWPRGNYSIQDDKLILKVNDKEEYKFTIDGEKLVFEGGTKLLKEGAVFKLLDKNE